jgi:hypothetical protein
MAPITGDVIGAVDKVRVVHGSRTDNDFGAKVLMAD